MQKVTLSFPNHDSLWSFKDKSKAINVTVTPSRNTISGPFSSEEVDFAVQQFRAVPLDKSSINTNTSPSKHTETSSSRPWFMSRFQQLFSV